MVQIGKTDIFKYVGKEWKCMKNVFNSILKLMKSQIETRKLLYFWK